MTVRCVGDFLKVVDFLYPENQSAYFRGQDSNSYDVNSSLCRYIKENKQDSDSDNFGYRLTRNMFMRFKNNFPIYPESQGLENYTMNELDILVAAQHYGLSTRLIDFTKNPLVALYFATEKSNSNSPCSVFMHYHVDSIPLTVCSSDSFYKSVKNEQNQLLEMYNLYERGMMTNEKNLLSELHKLNTKPSVDDYDHVYVQVAKEYTASNLSPLIYTKPEVAANAFSLLQKNVVNTLADISTLTLFGNMNYLIEPLPINPRIRNQQGVLMFSKDIDQSSYRAKEVPANSIVNSTDNDELNSIDLSSGMIRIDIDQKLSQSIQQELARYGITKSFIYPEITSFSENTMNSTLRDMRNNKI